MRSNLGPVMFCCPERTALSTAVLSVFVLNFYIGGVRVLAHWAERPGVFQQEPQTRPTSPAKRPFTLNVTEGFLGLLRTSSNRHLIMLLGRA